MSRWRRPLLVAGLSDALSFGLLFSLAFGPLLQLGVDLLTALLLFWLLGRRWQLLLGLFSEALPFLSAFPAWTLVVLALMAAEKKAPHGQDPRP